ncbi:MAG: DUF2155 domain-containing protein [Janthinobacterium lividum]
MSSRASPVRTAAPRALALALLAALPRAHAAEIVPSPVLPDPGTWLPRPVAELRVLDKIGAQAAPMVLSVGQGAAFHSLTVTLRACAVRPPELPPDSAAFLDIVDSHEGQPGFHGWMFSGEPQIAMLENPLYDVHLMSCRADPAAPAAPAPAPPPGRAPR